MAKKRQLKNGPPEFVPVFGLGGRPLNRHHLLHSVTHAGGRHVSVHGSNRMLRKLHAMVQNESGRLAR